MSDFFWILISINILLLITYSLFYILFKNKLFDYSISELLMTSKILFLTSLASPILLSFIPLSENLPKLNMKSFFVENLTSYNQSNQLINKNFSKIKLVSETKNSKLSAFNYEVIFWIIYGIGFLIFFLKFIKEIAFFNKLTKRAVLIKKNKLFKVYFSSDTAVGFTMLGLNGPIIVLPSLLIERNSDQKMVYAHELQHIRQKDIHWSALLSTLKLFLWFNPVFYIWEKTFHEIAEMLCDQNVLKSKSFSKKEYLNCLLRVAQDALNDFYQPVYAVRMANIKNKSVLSRRIDMLLRNNIIIKKNTKLKTFGILCVILGFSLVSSVNAMKSNIETDPSIQNITDIVLKEGVEKAQAKNGFALVSNPLTGEILALSYFDIKNGFSNKLAVSILSKASEPYSQIKPLIASVALEQDLIDENYIFDVTGGKIKIGEKIFSDWKDLGKLTLSDAITWSSNIASFKMANIIGEETLYNSLERFGLGDKHSSTSDLSWANHGVLHKATGHDSIYNSVYLSSGSGNIFVTPLELMMAYGAITNGGKLLQPQKFANGKTSPIILGQPISERTSNRMKNILRRVVTDGTGRWAQSAMYAIAGKTATGFVNPEDAEKGIKANRARFIGFAPYNNPKLLVQIIIDHPKDGAHGSSHAAPVVRSIINQVLSNWKVPADHYSSKN